MEKDLNKYIVYCTINKINKHFYIGVHKTTTDKFDGYLGNGITTDRPSRWNNPCRNSILACAIKKYGVSNFIRITLFSFKTEDEAYKMEEKIVTKSFIERKDTYNIALGGNRGPVKCTKVFCYDLNGNYIKEYNSIKEVGQNLNLAVTSMSQCIKLHMQLGGYLWSYKKVDHINPWTSQTKARPVAVYNSSGELIRTYPTIIACRKDYCGCIHVLYGKRKHCKNCTFKFVD